MDKSGGNSNRLFTKSTAPLPQKFQVQDAEQSTSPRGSRQQEAITRTSTTDGSQEFNWAKLLNKSEDSSKGKDQEGAKMASRGQSHERFFSNSMTGSVIRDVTLETFQSDQRIAQGARTRAYDYRGGSQVFNWDKLLRASESPPTDQLAKKLDMTTSSTKQFPIGRNTEPSDWCRPPTKSMSADIARGTEEFNWDTLLQTSQYQSKVEDQEVTMPYRNWEGSERAFAGFTAWKLDKQDWVKPTELASTDQSASSRAWTKPPVTTLASGIYGGSKLSNWNQLLKASKSTSQVKMKVSVIPKVSDHSDCFFNNRSMQLN